MAVVEVGWTVRAGYVGDTKCTRRLPSLCLAEIPTEMCLPSILMAADAPGTGDIHRLWSPQSLEDQMDDHVGHLAHIMGNVLQLSEDDPLMLVVPEVWHERFDVIRSLFLAVLDSGLTSAMYCFRPSVAWTLASGRASAVVLDVGHSHATATAVLDGYALRGTVASSGLAGKNVTQRLREMMDMKQLHTLSSVARYHVPSVQNWALSDVTEDIKQMACFVRSGGSTLPTKNEPLVLRAPDGSSITVPAEARTGCYEVLFCPPNDTGASLADILVGCRGCLDPEWQQQGVPHVLCGGTSQAPGIRERILKETQKRDSFYFRYEKEGTFNVLSATDGAWAGASLAADSSSFASLWVTRADLEEEGDSVLCRKLHY